MPKSNRSGVFGQRGGTVTVIEQPVLRSYMRKAKAVFWIAWVAVGLLAAVVIASKLEPILALRLRFALGRVRRLLVDESLGAHLHDLLLEPNARALRPGQRRSYL